MRYLLAAYVYTYVWQVCVGIKIHPMPLKSVAIWCTCMTLPVHGWTFLSNEYARSLQWPQVLYYLHACLHFATITNIQCPGRAAFASLQYTNCLCMWCGTERWMYRVPLAAKKLPKGTSGPQRTGGNSREPYVSDRQPQQQSVSLHSRASFLVSSSCVNYKENI